ncbi:hypothetical protein [Burkholderia stagnalis]|uniref:hypothetical protein n=1 Tax=Burkholderia stagnalis TaxID=1503054 RepID=UPI000AFA4825|nr:hypothetical protein [Burkholderia stagnalis]
MKTKVIQTGRGHFTRPTEQARRITMSGFPKQFPWRLFSLARQEGRRSARDAGERLRDGAPTSGRNQN